MEAQRYTTLQPDLFERHKTVSLEPELRKTAVAALAQLMATVVGLSEPVEREDGCDDDA
jgi:hypothetical protein